MRQGALTIVARVRSDRKDALNAALHRLGEPLRSTPRETGPFAHMSEVHFARWALVDVPTLSPGAARPPALLAFESNFDGDEKAHLDSLARHAADWLDELYDHCADYPEPNDRTIATRIAFLEKKRIPYKAWHNAHPGLSAPIVINDRRLRAIIQDFLDLPAQRRFLDAKPGPREIVDLIRDHVRDIQATDSTLVTGHVDRGVPFTPRRFWIFAAAIGGSALLLKPRGTLKTVAAVAAVASAFLLNARRVELAEDKDRPKGDDPDRGAKERADPEHMRAITDEEDRFSQNPLTHFVALKPGRKWMADVVFAGIETLARIYYTNGYLGSISTIHFARWVYVHDDEWLLFFSNYDGSWESYLGDFVDRTSKWLTAIWSNSDGFPRTKFLLFAGANDEDAFKRWTREHQLPTPIWYSAYPDLSVSNVLNNAAIREELFSARSDKELRAFLARL